MILGLALLIIPIIIICLILKLEKDWIIRIIYGFCAFSFYFLFAFLVLDGFNLPTKLGITKNIIPQNWLSFLGTYISAIITAASSSLFLFLITEHQINKSDDMNKENLRVQNIPILKYDFSDIKNFLINVKDNKKRTLTMTVKNVGLGAIKNINIIVKFNNHNNEQIYLENQSIIEKGESRDINIDANVSSFNNHDDTTLEIIVKYKDILNNWYSQKIILEYQNNANQEFDIKYNVCEEQLIEKKTI